MTTTAQVTRSCSRLRLRSALGLASLLLGLTCIGLGPVAVARAGEWVQRSCSHDGEYIVPEGWEAKANYGYKELPGDYCEKVAQGGEGGLTVFAAPYTGNEPFAGQSWIYRPPYDSTIAGGSLQARLRARNGSATVVAVVAELPVSQVCEYPSCELFEGEVPIPAGASEVYVRAACLPSTESGPPFICDPPGNQWADTGDAVYSAEADVSSAEVVLDTKATPKGAGFSGTLLNETVSGTGTLNFTATDPGPGVYQTRVKIDGDQVWAETPNVNEGKCVPAGTIEGVRVFNHIQPCPTETAVHAEVHTAALADGTHTLTVEVEDAAGDVATVYTGTLISSNHAVVDLVPTISPPERGACNGTPCDETAKLLAGVKEPKTFTRAFGRSTVTLTGRLVSPAGAPIRDAQVKLLQQVVGSTATTAVATATTRADGSWSLEAPAGPSRLLRVAFYSHALDTLPASVLDFRENVQGAVSMHAPSRAWLGRPVVFTGRLAGGYVPANGESVQMEIFYSGRWRTIEVLPTTSKGRWTYRYVFTLGAGTSYLFRAVTVPNGGYPYTSAHSEPVRVTIQR